MDNLERTVDVVRKRLVAHKLLNAGITCGLYLAGGVAGVLIIHKLLYLPWLLPQLAIAAVLCFSVIQMLRRLPRVSAVDAAVAIDADHGLKERLSSVIALAESDEPMLPALRTDAEYWAARIDTSRFRFKADARLSILAVAFAALAAAVIMPSVDILGNRAAAERNRTEREEVKQQAEHIEQRALSVVRQLEPHENTPAAQLADRTLQLGRELQRKPGLKQDAMVKMARLGSDVAEHREGMKRAEDFGSLQRDNLAKAASLSHGLDKVGEAFRDMMRAIEENRMADAAKELRRLASELQKQPLTAEQNRDLAEALRELAATLPPGDPLTQQMQELAEMLDQLANKDLAELMKNPALNELLKDKAFAEAVQKLLEENRLDAENLANLLNDPKLAELMNDPRMAELMNDPRLAELMEKIAQKFAEGLTPEQLAQMLENIQTPNMEQMLAQMEDMAKMLEDLERLLAELEACDDLSKMLQFCQQRLAGEEPCESCEGAGCAACGWKMAGKGLGMFPGQGQGPSLFGGLGQRPVSPPSEVQFNPTRVPGKLGPGEILATQFTRGMPNQDADADAEYRNVVQSARKIAEDAIRRDDIPPEYRERIRSYFKDLDDED